jgi:hypothetical protein
MTPMYAKGDLVTYRRPNGALWDARVVEVRKDEDGDPVYIVKQVVADEESERKYWAYPDQISGPATIAAHIMNVVNAVAA